MTVFMLIIWSCAAEKNTSNDTQNSDQTNVNSSDSDDQNQSDNDNSDNNSEPDNEQTEPDSGEPSEPDNTEPAAPLALIGSYTDNTGSEHVITSSIWTIDYGPLEQYSYYISQYSNEEQTVIAENAAQNGAPEAGAWSRVDWAVSSDGLWVCQTTNTAATEAEAMTTPPADVNDLVAGCQPYGWLQLY